MPIMKSFLKDATTKSIDALAKHLDALHCAQKPGKQHRAPSKLTRDIGQIHIVFYGDVDHDPNPKQAAKLVARLLSSDLFCKLILNQCLLEFEAKKQSADIIAYIVRRCTRNRCDAYIGDRTDRRNGSNSIVDALFSEYAAFGSSIIHEMVKRPEMATMLLNLKSRSDTKSESDCDFADRLLTLAESDDFNVSSNAYRSLSALLLHAHSGLGRRVAAYLDSSFDRVVPRINSLVQRNNFVRQKQFLSLLYSLLTRESNYAVAMRYLSQKDNLAAVLLTMHKYRASSVSLEAYQVFKLFLATPRMSREVRVVLWNNKARLLALLSEFHSEKAKSDAVFAEDRRVVVLCVKSVSCADMR